MVGFVGDNLLLCEGTGGRANYVRYKRVWSSWHMGRRLLHAIKILIENIFCIRIRKLETTIHIHTNIRVCV